MTHPTAHYPLTRAWLALIAPPFIFLLLIVLASIYFGASAGQNSEAVAAKVSAATPQILVGVQIALGLLLLGLLRSEGRGLKDIGWKTRAGQKPLAELLLGASLGGVLGLVYVLWLSPLMTLLQRTFGDYVPAGELLPSLGASLVFFFIANVLLAPWVEENLYRGYAVARLSRRFSPAQVLWITCALFGLLHWAGGFWYMLLTAIVAGGLFGGLRLWRGNVLAPFGAHLALNLLEFIYIWQQVAR